MDSSHTISSQLQSALSKKNSTFRAPKANLDTTDRSPNRGTKNFLHSTMARQRAAHSHFDNKENNRNLSNLMDGHPTVTEHHTERNINSVERKVCLKKDKSGGNIGQMGKLSMMPKTPKMKLHSEGVHKTLGLALGAFQQASPTGQNKGGEKRDRAARQNGGEGPLSSSKLDKTRSQLMNLIASNTNAHKKEIKQCENQNKDKILRQPKSSNSSAIGFSAAANVSSCNLNISSNKSQQLSRTNHLRGINRSFRQAYINKDPSDHSYGFKILKNQKSGDFIQDFPNKPSKKVNNLKAIASKSSLDGKEVSKRAEESNQTVKDPNTPHKKSFSMSNGRGFIQNESTCQNCPSDASLKKYPLGTFHTSEKPTKQISLYDTTLGYDPNLPSTRSPFPNPQPGHQTVQTVLFSNKKEGIDNPSNREFFGSNQKTGSFSNIQRTLSSSAKKKINTTDFEDCLADQIIQRSGRKNSDDFDIETNKEAASKNGYLADSLKKMAYEDSGLKRNKSALKMNDLQEIFNDDKQFIESTKKEKKLGGDDTSNFISAGNAFANGKGIASLGVKKLDFDNSGPSISGPIDIETAKALGFGLKDAFQKNNQIFSQIEMDHRRENSKDVKFKQPLRSYSKNQYSDKKVPSLDPDLSSCKAKTHNFKYLEEDIQEELHSGRDSEFLPFSNHLNLKKIKSEDEETSKNYQTLPQNPQIVLRDLQEPPPSSAAPKDRSLSLGHQPTSSPSLQSVHASISLILNSLYRSSSQGIYQESVRALKKYFSLLQADHIYFQTELKTLFEEAKTASSSSAKVGLKKAYSETLKSAILERWALATFWAILTDSGKSEQKDICIQNNDIWLSLITLLDRLIKNFNYSSKIINQLSPSSLPPPSLSFDDLSDILSLSVSSSLQALLSLLKGMEEERESRKEGLRDRVERSLREGKDIQETWDEIKRVWQGIGELEGVQEGGMLGGGGVRECSLVRAQDIGSNLSSAKKPKGSNLGNDDYRQEYRYGRTASKSKEKYGIRSDKKDRNFGLNEDIFEGVKIRQVFREGNSRKRTPSPERIVKRLIPEKNSDSKIHISNKNSCLNDQSYNKPSLQTPSKKTAPKESNKNEFSQNSSKSSEYDLEASQITPKKAKKTTMSSHSLVSEESSTEERSALRRLVLNSSHKKPWAKESDQQTQEANKIGLTTSEKKKFSEGRKYLPEDSSIEMDSMISLENADSCMQRLQRNQKDLNQNLSKHSPNSPALPRTPTTTINPDFLFQPIDLDSGLSIFNKRTHLLAPMSSLDPSKAYPSKSSPSEPFPFKPFTLVLDLDETLIHYNSEKKLFHLRPFLTPFLATLSNYYEILVYSAATRDYGKFITGKIDQEGKWIMAGIYREGCVKVLNSDFGESGSQTKAKDDKDKGLGCDKEAESSQKSQQGSKNPKDASYTYLKDLSLLNRPLSRTLIIDNSPVSFRLHRENGIFIKAWYGAEGDKALRGLMEVLLDIVDRSGVFKGGIYSKQEGRSKQKTDQQDKENKIEKLKEPTSCLKSLGSLEISPEILSQVDIRKMLAKLREKTLKVFLQEGILPARVSLSSEFK